MKHNKSINQTMQPAAAPLQQEAQPRALPNRATRRSKSFGHHTSSDIATPTSQSLLREHAATHLGVPIHDRILRLPEVLAMVGIGRTLLLGMVKNQQFPAPLKLSARIRGWRLSAVLAFVASKEAE
jgi:predicted DNA-binding transcriptional regulator AlpA